MTAVDTNLLLGIGISLSKEKDVDTLLMTILSAAMDITNCDGGTLYILKNDALHFHILCTRSMCILRSAAKETIDLPPVALDKQNVCAYSAITREMVNIDDVYTSRRFDFAGPRKYDALTGFRTQSMLVVPMEDDKGEIIGVMQLINALDENGLITSFDPAHEPVVLSLASQAAIRLTNMNYAAEVLELLNSFVRVMSTAIDARSPYNANHTRNMVLYAERFIDRLGEVDCDWALEENRRQFIMSVWLHDIGKLVIPLEIMDKQSRLGDRLDEILHRLALAQMWVKIDALEGKIDAAERDARTARLKEIAGLICGANEVGFLSDDTLLAIAALDDMTWRDDSGTAHPLLDECDRIALNVRRGTLTDEERLMMQSHADMTRRMLDGMTFSKSYRYVPDWASAHHEMLNGKGYPKGLAGDEIPREVRLLSIIDIFDALTARDRPYKPPMPTEKALAILDDMAEKGQLDAEIVGLFKRLRPWSEEFEK